MHVLMDHRGFGAVDGIRDARMQLVGGVLLGAIWAAALRAYMSGLAGTASLFTWWGTFGALILPGAVSGGLLAVAWRRASAGRACAWWALSPTPLAVFPLLTPGALEVLLTTGQGSSAIALVATAVIGGAAVGQRGPTWVRVVLAVVWVALIAALGSTVVFVGGYRAASPRGLWLIMLVVGLMALLTIACAAPFQRRRAASPS